jgi:hypothetical protein
VRPPLANTTGVEVVESPPSAAAVACVVGSPGTGAKPCVPIDLGLGRQRLSRQPVVPHLGCIPWRYMRTHGVHLTQASESKHLITKGEVALTQSLRPGLIDSPVALGGLDHGTAFDISMASSHLFGHNKRRTVVTTQVHIRIGAVVARELFLFGIKLQPRSDPQGILDEVDGICF